MTVDWNDVARRARGFLDSGKLDEGQADSLDWIADRLREAPGAILADEVGTGKTRIACALIHAVVAAGGRVATVVPKGLMHQWQAEAKELDDSFAAKAMTTLPELFRRALDEDWSSLAPSPSKPEWLLLSHNFRVPQVRANSHTWRAALPALVELLLAPKPVRQDRRTREGRLDEYMGLNVDAKHTTKAWAAWDGIEHIAKDVIKHVPKEDLRELRAKLKRLPDLKITKDGGKLDCNVNVDAFRAKNGEGVSEEILGLWLGRFDLVVIDEAHKSRGAVEDEDETKERTGKVLARLLGRVIRPSTTLRRLCLTATPMELDLHQWIDLLARAGCRPDDAKNSVETLKTATQEAATAPDELGRLERLREAAVEFTKTLKPFVTRRRRTEDPLVQQVRTLAGGDGPHPHRNVQPVRIEWSDPAVRANSWLDVLFAAECMSHAARGLTRSDTAGWPSAIRDAYTKLCRGHVSADIEDTDVSIELPSGDETDAITLGKIERVDYWYQQLRDAHARADAATEAGGLAESEHPRITLAVREIERWTKEAEKVLVFGVFLAPLKVLRNVLNVRSALRAADAGRPIAHVLDQAKEMPIAMRQLTRMQHDGALRGHLCEVTQSRDLEAALRRGKKTYSDLQDGLRDRRAIDETIEQWMADPRRLRGIEDKQVLADLRTHTMAFILDEFLTTNDHREERVPVLAETYFERHVAPELADADDEDEPDERLRALRAIFDEDDDTRQRRFAVLLAGDTQSSTRRYIQAAFNRTSSSPRVLIAQSQVGREGLNLHEACRVVMQFHAEWNPAVLEQQIGRVDRKNSRWEQLAKEWLKEPEGKPLPRIEVRQLVFEGTYDAYQWERVARRQVMFDASLFGSLLPAEAWARVPAGERAALEAAAPNFRPPRRTA